MRTIKALACAAALAAGLATAVAQNVYSLNVVGYYNITVPNNAYMMIANQLNTTNNQIQYLLPNVQNDSLLFKYSGGAYQTTQFEDYNPGWDQPTYTLNPGETAMFKDPGAGGQTLTFVGEVMQGQLVNPLAVGAVCFRSSMVPQEGTLAALGVPGENDDLAFIFTGGAYQTTQFEDYNPGWDFDGSGNGPTISVGQGFGYLKAAGGVSTAWVRNFTVQ